MKREYVDGVVHFVDGTQTNYLKSYEEFYESLFPDSMPVTEMVLFIPTPESKKLRVYFTPRGILIDPI